jgi:glycosyltransferase involved in cell wall biosynthesis
VEGVRVITLVGSGRGWKKLIAILKLVRQVVTHCRIVDPDVIVLEGASWASYHWMLLRALRRARLRARVWYHAHNVEKTLRADRNGWAIAKVTGWAEGRLMRGADRAFAVSAVDAGKFKALYGAETALWANGVDVDRFAAVTIEQIQSVRSQYGIPQRAVLFMGLYDYPPNTRAVDFLNMQVMPVVRARVTDATLVVLGGQVPYDRPWMINPGVVPFADLPAVVSACAVGVAPVFEGSGTRLKILEYGAAALAVVATRKGAEGLDVTDGGSILLCENDVAFAEAIAAVLTTNLRGRLGAALREVVYRGYDYRGILQGVWANEWPRG